MNIVFIPTSIAQYDKAKQLCEEYYIKGANPSRMFNYSLIPVNYSLIPTQKNGTSLLNKNSNAVWFYRIGVEFHIEAPKDILLNFVNHL
jgi:hypothetical protein